MNLEDALVDAHVAKRLAKRAELRLVLAKINDCHDPATGQFCGDEASQKALDKLYGLPHLETNQQWFDEGFGFGPEVSVQDTGLTKGNTIAGMKADEKSVDAIIPLKSIEVVQPSVTVSKTSDYIQNPPSSKPDVAGLIRNDGSVRWIAASGTHRLAAASLRGEGSVQARVQLFHGKRLLSKKDAKKFLSSIAKFDPDEARDDHGRWTSGSVGEFMRSPKVKAALDRLMTRDTVKAAATAGINYLIGQAMGGASDPLIEQYVGEAVQNIEVTAAVSAAEARELYRKTVDELIKVRRAFLGKAETDGVLRGLLRIKAALGRVTKYDESQPRDERGRWSTTDETFSGGRMNLLSIEDAERRGAFELRRGQTRDGFGSNVQTIMVKPNDVPEGWKMVERGSDTRRYYDPTHVEPDPEWAGGLRVKNPEVGAFPDKSEPGVIYRGMSHEEYQTALANGFFESRGDYNLGDEQKGLTFFSTDPSQAESYANGFAPWSYKATPSRPAVVVGIDDPGGHVDVPGLGRTTTEVAIRGRVPIDRVRHVWHGEPYSITEGTFDVVRDKYRGTTIGGGSSYSSSVRWVKQPRVTKYDESQPRDERGRWIEVGDQDKSVPVTLAFGGSFNPPHEGHAGAMRDAIERMEAQGFHVHRAVVVPSPDRLINRKLGAGGYPLTERVELARRQFSDVPRVEVTGDPSVAVEAKEGKLRRTDTADFLAARYPSTRVVTVTGHAEAPGLPGGAAGSEVDATLYTGSEGSHAGYHYLSLPRPAEGVSSSQIRAAIREGREPPGMKPETRAYLMDMFARRPEIKKAFNPDETRDDHGRWTGGSQLSSSDVEKLEPAWSRINDPKLRANAQYAVGTYVGSQYDEINGDLRSGDALDWASGKNQTAIRGVDRAFDYAGHDLSQDTVLYRGFGSNHLAGKELSVGTEFDDRGFVSTSPFERTAKSFAGDDGYLVAIQADKGTRVLAPTISNWEKDALRRIKSEGIDPEAMSGSEPEILLRRGTRFRVIEREGRNIKVKIVR